MATNQQMLAFLNQQEKLQHALIDQGYNSIRMALGANISGASTWQGTAAVGGPRGVTVTRTRSRSRRTAGPRGLTGQAAR